MGSRIGDLELWSIQHLLLSLGSSPTNIEQHKKEKLHNSLDLSEDNLNISLAKDLKIGIIEKKKTLRSVDVLKKTLLDQSLQFLQRVAQRHLENLKNNKNYLESDIIHKRNSIPIDDKKQLETDAIPKKKSTPTGNNLLKHSLLNQSLKHLKNIQHNKSDT